MPRAAFPVAVHLFLYRDERILLLRRFQTGFEDGNYSVIAGHVERGEDVYAAIIREAMEEAGILIDREDLKITQVMQRKALGHERIDYFFECGRYAGEPVNAEPEKCDEVLWAPVSRLPANMVAYVRAALKNKDDGVAFSLFGWEKND